MKRLAIIGGGDHGIQLAYIAEATGKYEVVGYFDDIKTGLIIGEKSVIGKVSEVQHAYEEGIFDEIIIGIGYKHLQFKKLLYEKLMRAGITFATLIHPTANIHPTCTIQPGSVIYQGVILDIHVELGPQTVIFCGCVIAHDSKIAGHSFLSPSVNLAGYTSIGSLVHIGIGVTVIDSIKICDGVLVGAGALVVEDIVKSGLYYGVPAKWRK